MIQYAQKHVISSTLFLGMNRALLLIMNADAKAASKVSAEKALKALSFDDYKGRQALIVLIASL